jgi:hypothetical protein
MSVFRDGHPCAVLFVAVGAAVLDGTVTAVVVAAAVASVELAGSSAWWQKGRAQQ